MDMQGAVQALIVRQKNTNVSESCHARVLEWLIGFGSANIGALDF